MKHYTCESCGLINEFSISVLRNTLGDHAFYSCIVCGWTMCRNCAESWYKMCWRCAPELQPIEGDSDE